jgi:addiction module RelE/StbE family toxin
MYVFVAINKRVDKKYTYYLQLRQDIRNKLQKVAESPRYACDSHPLHGHLDGKWGCWLGSNIRMVYEIRDETKEIIVFSIGSHTVYG